MNRFFCTSILFLVLLLAGHADAQTATTSGDSSRAIAGRVLDHNGLPIKYKHIDIHKVGGGPQGHRENYTDRAGEFRFDGLASGVYQVSMVGVMGEAGNRFYRPGEFVTFRMEKGGVITGTVADRKGKPIIAARVQVIRVRDENGRR